MKSKISDKEIEDKILEIIDKAWPSPLSIREVTTTLKEKHDMGLSPQIVKEHLFKLQKEGKIN